MNNIRYAFRSLVKNPAFTILAVLTLAIGIGANSAIYTVAQPALLRSLPYSNPDRLVYLTETNPREQTGHRQASYPDYLDWKGASAFESVAGYTGAIFFASGSDSTERISGARVTASFFETLGVPLALGRGFTEGEENGSDPVAIVSHGYWLRRLAGNAGTRGERLNLGGELYKVIGVLPRQFHFAPLGPAEIWVPLNPTKLQRERRFMHWLWAIARLKPGLSIEEAQPELSAIAVRIAQGDPQFHSNTDVRSGPLSQRITGAIRPVLIALLAAVGFVLLIACVNVANLALVRSVGVQKEIAIRVAVGASRRQLAQQLIAETALLAVTGAGLGLMLAGWGVRLLIALVPDSQMNSMPFLQDLRIDSGVLLFTMALATLTGVLCGLVPAFQSSALDIRSSLTAQRRSLRNGLVVAEIAFALVLLVGAGLMMKSMNRLLNVDPGFDSSNLATMRLTLMGERYTNPDQRITFFQRLMDQVRGLPGVQDVTMVDLLPLAGGGNTGTPSIEGRPAEPNERIEANLRVVDPNYFTLMGIALAQGRHFSLHDAAGSPRVVLINRAFVTRAFKQQDPLNRRFSFAFMPGQAMEIVGVVGDEKVTGLDAATTPVIYFPYAQSPATSMNLAVRTTADPAAVIASVRNTVRELDSSVPVYAVRTMEELVASAPYTFVRRYPALLMGIFALVALILTSIGIYGVVSYSVSQRTQELGVRIALGARTLDLLKLIFRDGLLLGSAGVGIGLLGAFALTRFLTVLLFDVTATDPAVFAGVSLLLMTVALLACYAPARRAMCIDPLIALRRE